MKQGIAATTLAVLLLHVSIEAGAAEPVDKSPHRALTVTVDGNVNLEVLDWGGAGRPLILLAGLSNTAHVFDEFAPKLAAKYRVYGITRRGFGNSDKPRPERENYSPNRLGDDVLETIAALGIDRPVLVGHSAAGATLSSIGSRFPERVAGLIYLDAAGPNAFYDAKQGNYPVELAEVRRKLDRLSNRTTREAEMGDLRDIVKSDALPRLAKQLADVLHQMEISPPPQGAGALAVNPMTPYQNAMNSSLQMFTKIEGPILSLVALPLDYQRDPRPEEREITAINIAYATRQAEAFQEAMPSARVVRLPYANHRVWNSNEAEVMREMDAFIAGLPTQP